MLTATLAAFAALLPLVLAIRLTRIAVHWLLIKFLEQED